MPKYRVIVETKTYYTIDGVDAQNDSDIYDRINLAPSEKEKLENPENYAIGYTEETEPWDWELMPLKLGIDSGELTANGRIFDNTDIDSLTLTKEKELTILLGNGEKIIISDGWEIMRFLRNFDEEALPQDLKTFVNDLLDEF